MSERMLIQRGVSPKDTPYPSPELDLGNIVLLKEPYESNGRAYKWGIIVEQISRNAFGHPRVSLHLYDDEGRLYMGPGMPTYVDFCASDFIVWKIAAEVGYVPVNHDMFPRCPKCEDQDNSGGQWTNCQECGGWGHVRQAVRMEEK
jgi:hypothetical protein